MLKSLLTSNPHGGCSLCDNLVTGLALGLGVGVGFELGAYLLARFG